MKLKTFCGIFGIELMSLTASAQDSLLKESHLNHLKKLEKYTPITKKEIQSDTNRFNMINQGLKEYINKIYIIDEKDFPDSDAAAHTHPHGGIICLPKYGNRDLFHEAGHVRHLALDSLKSGLSEKWKNIANFEYGKKNIYFSKIANNKIVLWKNGTIGPNYGCLEPSSGRDMEEDMAIFIESLGYEETPESLKKLYYQFKIKEDEILKENNDTLKLGLNLEFYSGYFPLYFADTTDRRYQQKLNLLKEYNFFTKEEHEKLSKNLGSLNYLLKGGK